MTSSRADDKRAAMRDESSNMSDAGVSGSDYEGYELPETVRKQKKLVRDTDLLQHLVVDLERENAVLRQEKRSLDAKIVVLLDTLLDLAKLHETT